MPSYFECLECETIVSVPYGILPGTHEFKCPKCGRVWQVSIEYFEKEGK